MAKVIFNGNSRSILGEFSGKVGNVVYGSWKGIPYVRSMPESVANPRTVGQLEQRAKMTTIVKFLQPLKVFLRVGFKSKTANMSAFNAATSYFFKNALTGTYPEYEIDYSKAMVSQGTLPGALHPSVRLTIPGEMEFRWDDNSNVIDARGDDKVMLMVYNPGKQEAVTIMRGHTRTSESQSITIPSSFVGDEVQCYIAFQSYWEKEVSDSMYVGGIVVEE